MNYRLTDLEPLLVRCEKPARYTGCERNIIRKTEAFFRGGISYPDLYEIGMANSGIQILYEKANAIEDVSVERIFAPAIDFSQLLKQHEMYLYTLESYQPLRELDSLSFNVAHELLLTNIAYILDCGGITIEAEKRRDGPVIIAGGEAVSNPSVVATMADIIFVGEGDEGYAALLRLLADGKRSGLSRDALIASAAAIESVLVPATRKQLWASSGMRVFDGEPVRRRLHFSQTSPSSVRPVVPTMRTGHERATLEISRGCYNLCKFCHAGYYQLPFRLYDVEDICAKSRSLYESTGYGSIGYNSLSISDCKNLAAIINRMLPWMNAEGLSMALPSLKVDLSTLPLIEALSGIRRTSLTFAIETANDNLRKCIHKRLSIDDVITIVTHVFERGWRTIKFYFMLGLPGYTEHDEIDSMISLLKQIMSATRNRAALNVTVSPFIPKPHTPFQFADMAPVEYFQNAVSRIKRETSRKIAVKNHNIRASIVEAFLARGDIRVGEAVVEAYRRGCIFDSWDEHFKAAEWFAVLSEYDKNGMYFRNFDSEGVYPWHIVDTGRNELIATLSKRLNPPPHRDATYSEELNTPAFGESMRAFERKYSVIGTLFITLEKGGVARFISHLDMLEVLRRSLRIAGLPAAFSQGFNKMEKIVTTQPLTLGLESRCEIFAVDMYAQVNGQMRESFAKALPEGFSVRQIEFKEGIFKNFAFNAAEYMIYFHDVSDHERFVLACSSDCMITKHTKKGERSLTLNECLISFSEQISADAEGNKRHSVCIRLFTEGVYAFRADLLIRQLIDREPLSVARIVKTVNISV